MSEPRDPPRWITDPEAKLSAGLRDALASHARAQPGAEVRARVLRRVQADLRLPPMAATPNRLGAGLATGVIVAAGFAAWFAREQPAAPRRVTAATARVDTSRTESLPPLQPSAAKTTDGSAHPAQSPGATPNALAHKHSPPPVPAAVDPRAELTLLVRARSLVSASPARALELVAEHATRYPHSMFAEEREVLAITAERRLGKTALAAEHARRFERAYPNSIHLPEVEVAPSAP